MKLFLKCLLLELLLASFCFEVYPQSKTSEIFVAEPIQSPSSNSQKMEAQINYYYFKSIHKISSPRWQVEAVFGSETQLEQLPESCFFGTILLILAIKKLNRRLS